MTAFERADELELGLLGSNLPCQGMSRNISDPTRISTYDACAEPTPSGPATSVLVARAFKNLTIPSSQIVIQPPDGTTLVNMDTLFSTQAEQYDQSLTLLGRNVTLRMTPTQFVWNTGDGGSFTTTTPGIPYEKGRPMSDYVSYKYLQPAKRLTPSVNVVWRAQYSVEGRPWQPVNGTVTTTGPGVPLRVREAIPVLTSGD